MPVPSLKQLAASNLPTNEIPLSVFYTTSDLFQQRFRALPGSGVSFNLSFRNLELSPDITSTVRDVLAAVLAGASTDFNDSDRLGVAIRSPHLDSDIIVPFTPKEKLTAEKLMILSSKVTQSAKSFRLDEQVEVQITGFHSSNFPRGKKGPPKIKGGAFTPGRYRGVWDRWYCEETKKNNGCLMKIENEDELCGPKAMVLGAYFRWSQLNDNVMKNRYKRIRKSMKSPWLGHLDRVVKAWITKAGKEDHTGPWSLEDLAELEKANLQPQVRLKVISKDWVDSCVYEGEKHENQLVVHLYHHDNHYSVIKSIAGFYNVNYYCEACNHAYAKKHQHPCTASCRFCGADPQCPLDGLFLECEICRRYFPSEACKARHYENNICNTIHRCMVCSNHYEPGTRHVCGLRHCTKCDLRFNEEREGVHYCYMNRALQKLPPGKRTHSREPLGPAAKVQRRYRLHNYPDQFLDMEFEERVEAMRKQDEEDMPYDYDPKKSYIFFDIESTQNEEVGRNALGIIYKHVPNLIVAKKCCSACKDDPQMECETCQEREKTFPTIDDFCNWLFSREHKGCTAIAHNAKGYDSQFLLNFIHEQAILPKVVPRGLSLLGIEAAGVRIIDSHSFLPMALSKLPSAFNLTELKKGYFPHLFNRPENMDYTGPLPDAKYYMPDQMTGKAREKFYAWYHANKHKTFKMREELEAYCTSDVDILMRACMAFRELFKSKTGTDPFNKLTIPSACMHVYRRNFLRGDGIIGLVPPQGYIKNDVQSRIATIWLMWKSQELGVEIQHSRNGGEVRFLRQKLDGLCRHCHDHAFEFLGCLWHGCPKCYKDRDHRLPNSPITVEMAYQKWLAKKESIGYSFSKLTHVWECEVRHELAHNPRMAEFFKNCPVAGPMQPREALYGGRTNAITLHHKCKPGEQISYIDVVSLYPYVMKHGMYPLGHPEIRKSELSTYTAERFRRRCELPNPFSAGIWKIKMLPPQDLFHGVLPYKSGDKLTFPLCRTCADTRQMSVCEHAPEERALTGAWTHLEVQKALDLGYEWLESYEAWVYEQLDQITPRNNFALFSEYINRFLKIKIEASGWPAHVVTDEDKDSYIQLIKDKEGITLKKDDVIYNPGLRQVAKLMLNSLWGKFAQRNDKPSPIYLKSVEEFMDTITNPTLEVHSVAEISPTFYKVMAKPLEEYAEGHSASNPIIAAYVTSQARLLLYSYLEKLQERVLYFDTDSIIYLTRPGEEKVKTGSYLGEMTDELEEFGPGAYIQEFVSAGPKNYAFKTINDAGESQTVTKIRGFSLAFSAAQDLNFDSLCRMVKGFVENGGQEEVTIEFPQIKRDKKAQVTTATSKKTYKVTYDKRRVIQNCFTTVPYGYLSPE